MFLILMKLFIEFLNLTGNLMYELADNGLKAKILTYSASTDSVTQPDPSFIQLSILCKIS